jgi:hypothetical protein
VETGVEREGRKRQRKRRKTLGGNKEKERPVREGKCTDIWMLNIKSNMLES